MALFTEITLLDHTRTLAQRAAARKRVGPYRWRPTAPGNGRGFYSSSRDACAMDERGSSLALRLEEANSHLGYSQLSRVNGYFCDQEGEGETLQPIIARLPSGRGFLAGWTMGAGMCASLDGHIWPEAEDAAMAAHDMAERDAERSREANERDSSDEEN